MRQNKRTDLLKKLVFKIIDNWLPTQKQNTARTGLLTWSLSDFFWYLQIREIKLDPGLVSGYFPLIRCPWRQTSPTECPFSHCDQRNSCSVGFTANLWIYTSVKAQLNAHSTCWITCSTGCSSIFTRHKMESSTQLGITWPKFLNKREQHSARLDLYWSGSILAALLSLILNAVYHSKNPHYHLCAGQDQSICQ